MVGADCVLRHPAAEIQDPRWWLAIGLTGVALMTKYTICVFIAGILAGVLLTARAGICR